MPSKELKSNAIILNPYIEIDKAIASKDWFNGFANCISYFEYYGLRKVNEYLINKVIAPIPDTIPDTKRLQAKNSIEDNVDRSGVKEIVFLLFTYGLIDCETFLGMNDVIKTRNDLVHPARKGIGLRYVSDEKLMTSYLTKSKEYIRKIV
jgi:hypothetical protein